MNTVMDRVVTIVIIQENNQMASHHETDAETKNLLALRNHIDARLAELNYRSQKVGDECQWCYEIIESEEHYCQ